MTNAFTIERPCRQSPLIEVPFHTWTLGDGVPWMQFYRKPNGYLLRFPALADFSVSADGSAVNCIPTPDVSVVEAEHLYLNQVLPLALSRLDRMVFHASAVALGDGAVCFVAPSGRGKSTLAASFAVNGSGLLTDDGLLIDEIDNAFSVVPSHPSIRLWADSEKALIKAGAEKTPALRFTSKSRILTGNQIPFCDRPRPLVRAYFLGEGTTSEIEFRLLGKAEALIAWIKHSFLLDVEDRSMLTAQFERVARLADTVECYHLDYPRRFEDLARLRNQIAQQAC